MVKKAWYETEEAKKRVHLSLSVETQKNLRTLQAFLEKSEEDVVSTGIEHLLRKMVKDLAVDQGLLEDDTVLSLHRLNFNQEVGQGCFDDICEKLKLRGKDGTTSSINSVEVHVKQAIIEGEGEPQK